jgi:hypothetical protein
MVVLRVNVKQTAMCCATKFWERGACTILPRRLEKNNVVLVGSATKIIKLFWESN